MTEDPKINLIISVIFHHYKRFFLKLLLFDYSYNKIFCNFLQFSISAGITVI